MMEVRDDDATRQPGKDSVTEKFEAEVREVDARLTVLEAQPGEEGQGRHGRDLRSAAARSA
jgi:hypothetical protein